MEIIAYHYSSKELKVGDIITSGQHLERMFSLVHGIFKEVNPKLAIFDSKWGYAYPEPKDMNHKYCYVVKAHSSRIIEGNFDYSVYYSMGCCQVDKSLPLKERLQKRDDHLRERAEKYFNPQGVNIELISDSFVIIEKLY
jgi:hypothetical protein